MTVSGLILAGGRATRLGTDKREIRVHGVMLLDRAIALMASLTDDLLVATRSQAGMHGRARVITDAAPDRGPMAGILAGLQAARHDRVLVVPVDMPLLTPAFLRYLVDAAPTAEVTVPQWRAGIEPLVGVYSTACVAPLQQLVERGTTAVHAFVLSTDLTVRYVDEPEIRAHGSPERLFLNINTPEDLRTAEAILRGAPPPDAPR